jgi:signal transduction histidine kinase
VVDNAVKYTQCGGRVIVSATAYTIFLRIDVEDNGIGIAEEEHSKIFLRFYRSPQVSEEKGVGIGLYLTREIVSMQGGYMKVISEPGHGSTFSIFLPREKYQKCDISETCLKH